MGGGLCRECSVSLKLQSEWIVSRRWGQCSCAHVHSFILHDTMYVAHWSLQSQNLLKCQSQEFQPLSSQLRLRGCRDVAGLLRRGRAETGAQNPRPAAGPVLVERPSHPAAGRTGSTSREPGVLMGEGGPAPVIPCWC